MHRWIKTALFALAACLAPQAAHAQFVQVYSPPPAHVVLPVTTYYGAPPVTVYAPPPVTTYYAPPVTTYYAPPVTTYYAPPVTTHYAPPVTTYYAPPMTTYYAPPATVYSPAPYAVYSAPAEVYTPGVVTTRNYTGLGIFRPRGTYTESYVTPVAPRTTYYVPGYVR